MAARREITKRFARQYARAGKADKGAILDALTAATGWTRDHSRRAIRQAAARTGAARDQQRTARGHKYSYDALVVLQEVWRLAGQPSGKYLAAVMGDTLDRLVTFRERGKVADRVTPDVLAELAAMSPATIDRYLRPPQAGRLPGGGTVWHPTQRDPARVDPSAHRHGRPTTGPGVLRAGHRHALRAHPAG